MICNICQKDFKNLQALNTHIMSKHKDIDVTKYVKENFDIPLCPICNNPVKIKTISAFYKTCGDKQCIEELKRQKRKQTNLDKFGVEFPIQSKKIRKKINKTNLEKFGSKWVMGSEHFKNKTRETVLNKYGVLNVSLDEDVQNKISNSLSKDKKDILLHLKDYEFLSDKYVNRKIQYKWKHNCGHIFTQTLLSNHQYLPNCPKCYPPQNVSSVEKEIREFLKQYVKIDDENFNKQFTFNNIRKEIDIFIPTLNLGIELNGIYWHSELQGNKNKNYHINKTNFFKNYFNIDIIHIWDSEWLNKQDIIKSILKNKIHVLTNKIYARKCVIKNVTANKGNIFLNNNHLQGALNSSVYLGLYYNDELVNLMSFKKDKQGYELTRFVNKIDTIVVGGFSKLLKHFLNMTDKNIKTFADKRFSNGDVYLKNGFKYSHTSSPNYFYTQNYKQLFSRVQFQKHKLSGKLQTFDEDLSEWLNMQLNGYDRIWDCGNMVFIYENEKKPRVNSRL